MQTLQTRHMTYDVIYSAAKSAYRDGGVLGVAQYLTGVIEDINADDDLTFMRLTACIRAEGLHEPTTPFIVALLTEVKKGRDKLHPDRAEMIQDMLEQISVDLCNELVVRSMNQARYLAQALGSAIDIRATSKGANDVEWMTLGAVAPLSDFLH